MKNICSKAGICICEIKIKTNHLAWAYGKEKIRGTERICQTFSQHARLVNQVDQEICPTMKQILPDWPSLRHTNWGQLTPPPPPLMPGHICPCHSGKISLLLQHPVLMNTSIIIQQFSFSSCNVILKFQPVLMNTSITCKIGYFSNITYIISTIFILHRAPGLGFTLIDFIFSLYFYTAVFFRLL